MISIIAAIGQNRELGKNNKLLWDIPEDMDHFRSITRSHAVIMGRKTYESIGHALPNRPNIVITRDSTFATPDGCFIVHSLDEAIALGKTKEEKELFIIGGANIYEQAIDIGDKLYLTIVHANFDADTFFPEYSRFSKVISTKNGVSNGYSYTFLELIPSF
ncbi:MAG: dihydrofolate reductase [Candidatus Gottesmanbacteria bacterium]